MAKKSENELLDGEPELDSELVDGAEAGEDEVQYPVTHVLKKPIKWGKKEITELVFNEPTAGDLLAIESTGNLTIAEILKLLGKFSLVPPSVLKQLAPWDLNACIDWVKLFLAPIKGPNDSESDSEL